jgi:DNA-binding NtrC family response regulator
MAETVDGRAEGGTLKDRLEAYERSLIQAALHSTAGNQRQAAFRLGVLPTTLHEKMKRLGMIPGAPRRRRAEPPVEAAVLEARPS